MSTLYLVEEFYQRIWNNGELAAASELLSEDFRFRGSLGFALVPVPETLFCGWSPKGA